MKKLKLFAFLFSMTALTTCVYGQNEPVYPTPAPGNAAQQPLAKRPAYFAISSREMPIKKVISGKTTAMIMIPPNIEAASVKVTLGDKSYDAEYVKPCKVEIDTTVLKDGDYDAAAVAMDASSKEVWKGSAKVTINNSGKPNAADKEARKVKRDKAKEKPNADLAPLPPNLSSSSNDKFTPIQEEVDTPAVSVTESYESKKWGVKLQYPGGWKVSDYTAKLKPQEPGGFWLAFSSPEDKPGMIINFKHKLLGKPTTADNYAKYNVYLLQWNRVDVNNKPAFETTQGAAESARVVHRKIIIDGKHIWMFNCIDQTGMPASDSKVLFDQVVNSMGKM